MRDAFGGLMNMVIIVVFLVLVSGYLAFNVNYTKAFRVKNKIITTIEQYEGNCESGSACDDKILEYMRQIGYNTDANFKIPDYQCQSGYCIKKENAAQEVKDSVAKSGGKEPNDLENKVYYRVTTVIVIDIPIINKIMPQLKLFQVSGTTSQFVEASYTKTNTTTA